jgi:hypothetical protein
VAADDLAGDERQAAEVGRWRSGGGVTAPEGRARQEESRLLERSSDFGVRGRGK